MFVVVTALERGGWNDVFARVLLLGVSLFPFLSIVFCGFVRGPRYTQVSIVCPAALYCCKVVPTVCGNCPASPVASAKIVEQTGGIFFFLSCFLVSSTFGLSLPSVSFCALCHEAEGGVCGEEDALAVTCWSRF